ncbi:MAG: carboxyltransferase domain-containing protein [Rhodobacteraceae bacterium]|nr:carboxyltransferase domain-containing protein [Paracoccaceae bacterium]
MQHMQSVGDSRFPQIQPMGEGGLLIVLADSVSLETTKKILAIDSLLHQCDQFTTLETVPALRSILVKTDPLLNNVGELEALCHKLLKKICQQAELNLDSRRFSIPVIYGEEWGPDLGDFCQYSGMSKEAAISLHTSVELIVLCLGFSPGLTYLAELPEEFNLPRKEMYCAGVPAGSVLIANRQTVFTASQIPTGWHRIGTSPVIGFCPEKHHPFLFRPGDRIRFFAIDPSEESQIDVNTFWL